MPIETNYRQSFIALCGSVRDSSSNLRLLQAAQHLTPADSELDIMPNLNQLPHFHPDVEPAEVVSGTHALLAFVTAVRAADGIIVSSPVYAGGYPGVLKNALDWLVGTDAFVNKPFMLLNASQRMPQVHETLITVLTTMSGRHAEAASLNLDLLADTRSADAIQQNPKHGPAIRAALAQFAAFTNEQTTQRVTT